MSTMDVQLYLVAPQNPDTASFADTLGAALDAAPVAALLLPRAELDEAGYETVAKTLIPLGQKHGAAVLLENTADLAKKLGADGVHITGGIKAVSEARNILGPDMIVGAGDLNSRHDAMMKAEAGIDYVMFGTPGAQTAPDTIGNALWWVETFEVPCVLYADDGFIAEMNRCEFAAIGGDAVWAAKEPAARVVQQVSAQLGVLA